MDGKIWTDEEEKFLIENKGVLSNKQIADELGRTASSIKHRYKKSEQITGEEKQPLKIGNKIKVLLNFAIVAIILVFIGSSLFYFLVSGKRTLQLCKPDPEPLCWMITAAILSPGS